ncbi:MAG: SurA N-terminal domain-containing protein [Candidatus Omnitrophota bacterium]
MLKFLRNKKILKKIWITLGIIIIPAFVFWGVGGIGQDKRRQANIGKIAGKDISLQEFRDSLSAVKNTAIMRYGVNFQEHITEEDLKAQAWDRLVLINEAKRLKIKASDKEVVELIESYPFFNRNGKFDNNLYKETLQYIFHSQARVFEEEQRQNIIISKLYQEVTSKVSLSQEDIRLEYIKIKSEADPKFNFNEESFLSERKEFEKKALEKKKEEAFLNFISQLIKDRPNL